MNRIFYSLIFTFCASASFAQKYSGQWSGSFDALGDERRTEYVLEIEAKGNTFEGTSTTYFIIGGKRYYTICAIKGTIDPAGKSLISTETSRIKANTPPDFKDCFQVHMLTYFRKGDTEELVGTWKGARKEDVCGTGSTSLSRKQLVKNLVTSPPPPTTITRNNTALNKPTPPQGNKPVVKSNPPKTTPATKPPVTTNKPVVKTMPKKDSTKTSPSITKAGNDLPAENKPVLKPNIPAPKLPNGLERRDNKVFETIAIDEEEITVNLYDNAEIDGDIITVMFNGEVVAAQKTLSDKPITLKLKAIKGRDNTLTMYAENQGSIPPNTAIMRVQCGNDFYKVFLSADDKKNASVVFRVK
ncbi:MAG: hypothetical protein K2X48_15070 [Chitinophagaceae bacterium]|nr:hypothetical protein [Chitinophagaceae bacterium]